MFKDVLAIYSIFWKTFLFLLALGIYYLFTKSSSLAKFVFLYICLLSNELPLISNRCYVAWGVLTDTDEWSSNQCFLVWRRSWSLRVKVTQTPRLHLSAPFDLQTLSFVFLHALPLTPGRRSQWGNATESLPETSSFLLLAFFCFFYHTVK